jgi:hypothetical protein
MVGGAVLLGGCGFLSLDEKSGSLRDLIQRNKANWRKAGIESYRFTYNKTVGSTEQDSVQVTVLEGNIDSVSMNGTTVDDPDSFLTVDRLYDEIEKNFERDDRGQFRVQFDEEFSYPERYRMAPGDETLGRGVVVTNFTLLGGAASNAKRRKVAERILRSIRIDSSPNDSI